MKQKPSNAEKRNAKHIIQMTETDDVLDGITFQEKPLICLIDIEDEVVSNLKKKGLNVKSGTLGKAINVPNEDSYSTRNHKCLLNYNLPENLHEYEVIILDLEDKGTIPYNVEEHTNEHIVGSSNRYLYSKYPETIFDPKPYVSSILQSKIAEIIGHEVILIIFATAFVRREYQIAKITGSKIIHDDTLFYDNYSFCSEIPYSKNKFGRELIVQRDSTTPPILSELLSKYILEATYHIVFNNVNSLAKARQIY